MAERTPYTDTGDEGEVGPDREPTPGVPRWVKASLIAVGVVVLLVVVLLVAGGHEGGPGRHTP